jgi:hypothetical protein
LLPFKGKSEVKRAKDAFEIEYEIRLLSLLIYFMNVLIWFSCDKPQKSFDCYQISQKIFNEDKQEFF